MSAFCRLFRYRVLPDFRLIRTLYLNLKLDIESSLYLGCSTRVLTPFQREREGIVYEGAASCDFTTRIFHDTLNLCEYIMTGDVSKIIVEALTDKY